VLESLQYVSLFYVTSTTLLAIGVFKELKFSGKILYTAVALFAFNPTLSLFSGYISDDAPVLLFSTAVIYFSLRWYRTAYLSDILFTAICLGVGTLAKISILMLVPALTFLFLYKLFSSPHQKEILFQESLFIIIAVPLALLWIFRNHILFDMPFNNVPDTSPAGQSFAHLFLSERISDFSQLITPFINSPYIVDSNIVLSFIKTELFGEWNLSLIHRFLYYPAVILYILNILLKILIAYAVCNLFYHPKSLAPSFLFMGIICLTVWAYAIKYALDYPYACSTDYRLIAILMPAEISLLFSFSHSKMIVKTLTIISFGYIFASIWIYGNLF
jgi:hypothetical protein